VAKLTAKQNKFVEEYLVDLNATQAAIRAGYSPDSAKEIASENLAKPNISNAISKAMAERSRRTGINQDRVLLELAKIAFLNPIDVININDATLLDEASRDDTAAIASVKVKTIPIGDDTIVEREVKTYDKIKALELIGKHLNIWNKKEIDIKEREMQLKEKQFAKLADLTPEELIQIVALNKSLFDHDIPERDIKDFIDD